MRAVIFDRFGGPLTVEDVPSPRPPARGVVVQVAASGICRSDWHGWQGHDASIALPHVPGHELAGTISAVGKEVSRWKPGARVTVPFVCACGSCPPCAAGNQQVCVNQTQPGFTHWGSFAEYVPLDHADANLVGIPEEIEFAAAASLGCRFGTAFRAVVQQGRVNAGDWVAVHGCGGVGLSAVHIASAAGARVIAVDVSAAALRLARSLGAEEVVEGTERVAEAVQELSGGGAHVSLDAVGSPSTCVNSVECLRARGRHVQVGLLPAAGGSPQIPMETVIARELELVGSHGIAAHTYPQMLGLVASGRLRPQSLVTARISLDEAGAALAQVGALPGMTVITSM